MSGEQKAKDKRPTLGYTINDPDRRIFRSETLAHEAQKKHIMDMRREQDPRKVFADFIQSDSWNAVYLAAPGKAWLVSTVDRVRELIKIESNHDLFVQEFEKAISGTRDLQTLEEMFANFEQISAEPTQLLQSDGYKTVRQALAKKLKETVALDEAPEEYTPRTDYNYHSYNDTVVYRESIVQNVAYIYGLFGLQVTKEVQEPVQVKSGIWPFKREHTEMVPTTKRLTNNEIISALEAI